MIRVMFVFIWALYKFVFQTDWLGNRRKEICDNGRRSGFPCDSYLVDVYGLLNGLLTFFLFSIQVCGLMYFDVVF
jgi:hypothetical protein